MENRERIYYAMGSHPEFDQKVVGWLQGLKAQAPRHGKQPPQEMIALDHVLHDMRLYKSRTESALMREAGRIAARRRCGPCATPGPAATNTRSLPS